MKIIRLFDNRYAFRLLAYGLLLMTLASCRKEEFQTPPEGEAVPHQEITTTLQETLQASPNTLFKAAWLRSNMNSILKKMGANVLITLMVPTDEAFIADGLTLDVINTMSPDKLDEILLYHTILGKVNAKDLIGKLDNTVEKTLLENPQLRLQPLGKVALFDKYYYRHYLKVDGTNLYINGKLGSNKPSVEAKDGVFWPVNQVLHKPTKTILETLKADPRFSIYLEVLQMNDDLWLELSEYSYPRDFTSRWIVNTAFGDSYPNISFTSTFAPTNDAFHKAGFADAQAVMELNNNRPQPHLDYDTYEMAGGSLTTDSLITMHKWDNFFAYVSLTYSVSGKMNETTFYSNDLTNELLYNYVVRVGDPQTPSLPVYVMPLEFSKGANGSIKVKAKGSTHPEATVVEGDINTLMGPIHVVDRLIVPKDLKF